MPEEKKRGVSRRTGVCNDSSFSVASTLGKGSKHTDSLRQAIDMGRTNVLKAVSLHSRTYSYHFPISVERVAKNVVSFYFLFSEPPFIVLTNEDSELNVISYCPGKEDYVTFSRTSIFLRAICSDVYLLILAIYFRQSLVPDSLVFLITVTVPMTFRAICVFESYFLTGYSRFISRSRC